MKIEKDHKNIIVVPKLFTLVTNVDYIYHFYLSSFMYKLLGDKTKLNFSYIVKNDIEKPPELNIRFDYFWGKDGDKRLYYEHPFFGEIKLKMLVEKKGNDFNFSVDRFYYKYIKFITGRVWPSGLHLQNATTLGLSGIGFTMLYGACISKNKQGILILASTKIGKSLTALSALERGYEILAEDFLVLDSKGGYSVPLIPSCFLKYHSTRSWWKKKFYRILLKFPLLQMVFLYLIPLSFFISPNPSKEYLDSINFTTGVKIRMVCILEKGKTGIKKLNSGKALKKIVALNRANSFYYNDSLLRAFSYFNPELNIEMISNMEEKNLSSIVNQSECYLLRAEDGKEYINLLDNI